MDVKSGAAGAFPKPFGKWRLEPLRRRVEDANFARFGGGLLTLIAARGGYCRAAESSGGSAIVAARFSVVNRITPVSSVKKLR